MKAPNRSRFLRWLRRKKLGERVGLPQEPRLCPLACYLNTGVYGEGYGPDIWTAKPLPQWALDFTKKIDRGKAPVTARRALKLLGESP